MADDDLPDAPWAVSQASAELPDAPWAAAQTKQAEEPEMSWGDIGKDVARSTGRGIVKGAISAAGSLGDVRELGKSAASGLGFDPSVGERIVRAIPGVGLVTPFAPTSEAVTKTVENTTGKFEKPKSVYGHYGETVGEMLPAAATGPGGVLRRIGMQAVLPGVASEAAGQLTEGSDLEPWARVGAAVAAPWGVSAARRAITPLPSAPGRQAMVNALENEGVTAATAGQRTGNKALQYAESTLGDYPLAGNQATQAQQTANRQFTEATLRRIGMNGVPPTRQNLDHAVQNIQDQFEALSARNTLRFDQQFGNDIAAAVNRYGRKLPSQQREVFANYLNDLTAFPNGMPGNVYQPLRSDLSRQAHGVRFSDPMFSQSLRDIRNALDGAMGRSITPADQQAWNVARRRWANWRTIERAAGNTDEAGNVLITPARLKESAGARDRGSFARGLGDYAGLAQAADPVLRSLPNSGTSQRVFATSAVTGALGGIAANIPGAILGAAAPGLAGRAIMSGPAQSYLGNQLLGAGFGDTQTAAITRALLAAKAAND